MLRSWAVAVALATTFGAQAQQVPQPRPPVFVLNSLSADIAVVDPVGFTVVKRIPTGKEPHHLYLSPDEKSLIVANALGDSLTFVDPRTAEVQRVVRGVPDPYHLRFSPDMKWLVIAANRLDHVDLYRWQGSAAPEPLQLVKRIRAPKTPSHLNIDTRSTTVYVSLQDSDELLAIDLATQAIKWKTPVGKMPADIYLTPDDKHLLVGLTGDKFVEVWDVSGSEPKLSRRIATGAGAHSFRAWGDKRHVLVSNRAANTISKIDIVAFAVVDQYPAPAGPDDMELLTDGRTLLVTSRWAGKVTQIDTATRKVVRQVKVGKSPHGIWTLDHQPRL